MAVPAVDDSEWPIVRITYPEEFTLDDVAMLADVVNRIFEKRGPMVTVSDISALSLTATASLRRRAVAREADKLADKGGFIGSAVVMRNPAARLVFQAYLWLRTSTSYPIQIFDDRARAERWARTLLAAKKR